LCAQGCATSLSKETIVGSRRQEKTLILLKQAILAKTDHLVSVQKLSLVAIMFFNAIKSVDYSMHAFVNECNSLNTNAIVRDTH